MSAYYEALAAKANALIREKGRPITFVRRGKAAAADLVSGTVDLPQLATTTLPAAVLPASGGTLEAFDVRFMKDIDAAIDVRFAVVSALDADGGAPAFEPRPGDEATFEGRTWQVMGNTPLNVDGTPVIYSIGFRGP